MLSKRLVLFCLVVFATACAAQNYYYSCPGGVCTMPMPMATWAPSMIVSSPAPSSSAPLPESLSVGPVTGRQLSQSVVSLSPAPSAGSFTTYGSSGSGTVTYYSQPTYSQPVQSWSSSSGSAVTTQPQAWSTEGWSSPPPLFTAERRQWRRSRLFGR